VTKSTRQYNEDIYELEYNNDDYSDIFKSTTGAENLNKRPLDLFTNE